MFVYPKNLLRIFINKRNPAENDKGGQGRKKKDRENEHKFLGPGFLHFSFFFLQIFFLNLSFFFLSMEERDSQGKQDCREEIKNRVTQNDTKMGFKKG